MSDSHSIASGWNVPVCIGRGCRQTSCSSRRCREICYAETGAIRELTMQQPSSVAALIAGLMLAASGCAGSATRPAPPPADAVARPAVTALTIDNILQWPLEGEKGFKRLRQQLVGALAVTQDSSTHWRKQGKTALSDGYALSFVTIKKFSDQIDMGIEVDPCLTPKKAQEWVETEKSLSSDDIHGRSIGTSYWSKKNGFIVQFRSDPVTLQCIDSISIINLGENHE